MADRLSGKTRVPAPAPRPYALNLLSALEALGLVHDAPEGSHLQNGVFWESDAAVPVTGNNDVLYDEGSFQSLNKTIQHGIAYTDGFGFELSRYVQLGLGAGGTMEEQRARAEERFKTWESADVARHIRSHFEDEGNLTPVTIASPLDAVALLLDAVGAVYADAPMILSQRGPSVRLLKDGAVETAGAVYIADKGFAPEASGPEDFGLTAIWATGSISIWRTPITVIPVPSPKVNEAEVLVERSYYVVVDGPMYGMRTRYVALDETP